MEWSGDYGVSLWGYLYKGEGGDNDRAIRFTDDGIKLVRFFSLGPSMITGTPGSSIISFGGQGSVKNFWNYWRHINRGKEVLKKGGGAKEAYGLWKTARQSGMARGAQTIEAGAAWNLGLSGSIDVPSGLINKAAWAGGYIVQLWPF